MVSPGVGKYSSRPLLDDDQLCGRKRKVSVTLAAKENLADRLDTLARSGQPVVLGLGQARRRTSCTSTNESRSEPFILPEDSTCRGS